MLDEIESRLKTLELKCRRPVEHLLAGEYRSIFRGRGVEFEDVRPYQPGDDVRTMDWKVTARTGEPYIKRYVEEREQFIYLLVDISASIRHRRKGLKSDTLVELCALLTMAAIQNQDRVGLVLFTDQIELVIPPAKGRRHAMRIMDELMHFEAQNKGTDLASALSYFGHLARKHSVAFVISDFLADDYVDEMRALAYKHDMNGILLSNSGATEKTASGLLRIEDAETGQEQVVDLKANRQTGAEREHALLKSLIDCGVNLLRLKPEDDSVEALAGFFYARQRQAMGETGG